MQLWCSSGEVQHVQIEALQDLGNQIDLTIRHHFRAPGSGIHMAVAAALVAAVAEVDLQGLQLSPLEGRKAIRSG